MRVMTLLAAGGLVLLLAVAGAGIANRSSELPAQSPGAAAIVVRGRIEPRGGLLEISAASLAPLATVGRLMVREGQEVAAGDLLAQLSTHEQAEAAVRLAAAALEVAERRVAYVRQPYKAGAVAALEATVEARAAELDFAERQSRRAVNLLRSGSGSQETDDGRRASLLRARAALEEARSQRQALTEISETELGLALAERDQAAARLHAAEADLRLTEIRAPGPGTILRIMTRAGGQVAGGTILQMADLRRPLVIAEVDEALLPSLAPGRPVRVTVRGAARGWAGRLERIRPVILQAERLPRSGLAPPGGRVAEVEIALEDGDGLPRIALLEVTVEILPP